MKSIDMLSKSKRDSLIKGIVDEFAEHGYQQASTNRIAKESGISKGSLFNYLGSKKDQYYFVQIRVCSLFKRQHRAQPRLL